MMKEIRAEAFLGVAFPKHRSLQVLDDCGHSKGHGQWVHSCQNWIIWQCCKFIPIVCKAGENSPVRDGTDLPPGKGKSPWGLAALHLLIYSYKLSWPYTWPDCHSNQLLLPGQSFRMGHRGVYLGTELPRPEALCCDYAVLLMGSQVTVDLLGPLVLNLANISKKHL